MTQYWFTSSLFEIEPGEDEEINPGIYGRQFANWLAKKLESKGYEIDLIEEDWGRCLMCIEKLPFRLWVGCANVLDYASNGEPTVPSKEQIVWTCFPVAEVPFLKRLFNRPDTAPALQKLDGVLREILESEPAIQMTTEP